MSDRPLIYFDYNATTPLCPRAREAMRPLLEGPTGNASSYHRMGRQARSIRETARRAMADVFRCTPGEVVFTGSGTEANNIALRGVSAALKSRGRHIITTAIEHYSVIKTAEALCRDGFEATVLPVDDQGVVDCQTLIRAIRPDTTLISVMQANNETGSVQPVEEIGRIARNRGIMFHSDAVQAFGKIPLGAVFDYADFVTIAAHKIYGPPGIGALLARRGAPIIPIMTGGHHEHGLRPGSENLPAIAGFAAAAVEAVDRLDAEAPRLAELRDRFERIAQQSIPAVMITSGCANRVPTTSNICFKGVESESVLLHLDLLGICASAGSACTTGEAEPSHVLLAMGHSRVQAQSAVRFSFGAGTTQEQIDIAAAALSGIIQNLREVSSVKVQ